MKAEKQFPILHYFLAAYFHQDWNLDDPDDVAVVRRYARETAAPDISQLVQQIEDYLSLPAVQKRQRGNLLDDFGCYAPASRQSDNAWLLRIQHELWQYQRSG